MARRGIHRRVVAGVTAMLPVLIARFANYDMIYGSLAGVMIALIFFFLVGWGLVVGAQLNAALAEADEQGVGSNNDAIGMKIA